MSFPKGYVPWNKGKKIIGHTAWNKDQKIDYKHRPSWTPKLFCKYGHLRYTDVVTKQTRCMVCTKGYFIKKYGITYTIYYEMLKKQNNRCAICGETDNMYLAIDHDHACCPGKKSCGKCIRALLCCHCNTMLGRAKDKVDILAKGIQYLQKYSLVKF